MTHQEEVHNCIKQSLEGCIATHTTENVKKMCLTRYLNTTQVKYWFLNITWFSHDPFKNNFVMHFSPSDSCLATVYSNSNLSSFLACLHPRKAPTEIALSIHMNMITHKWLNGPSGSMTYVNFVKNCEAISTPTETTKF
jgi:hypothetical protein